MPSVHAGPKLPQWDAMPTVARQYKEYKPLPDSLVFAVADLMEYSGRTPSEIARFFGVSRQALLSNLKRKGIKLVRKSALKAVRAR